MKEGETYHILNVGPNLKLKPYKIHVVAIVDEDYVAYKWFSLSAQRWRYSLEDCGVLQIKINKCKTFVEANVDKRQKDNPVDHEGKLIQ